LLRKYRLFKYCRQSPAEPGIEGILLRMLGSGDQVSASQRRKLLMMIVRQTQDRMVRLGGGHKHAIYVFYSPAIVVRGSIGLRVAECSEIG